MYTLRISDKYLTRIQYRYLTNNYYWAPGKYLFFEGYF